MYGIIPYIYCARNCRATTKLGWRDAAVGLSKLPHERLDDQPLNIRLRVSGIVEMRNSRPQITTHDSTQVAEWVNNGWCSMILGNAMDALLESLYR